MQGREGEETPRGKRNFNVQFTNGVIAYGTYFIP
jgi:hypothetical protein